MQRPMAMTKPVVVVGDHLVSKKILGMCLEIAAVENDDDTQLVRKLEFSIAAGMKEVGLVDTHAGNIVINVREIIDQILAGNIAADSSWGSVFNPQAEYVLQILVAMAHECGHIHHWHKDREGYKNIEQSKREADAEDHANEMLNYIAEEFDIEPTSLAEESYFGTRMAAMFIQQQTEKWTKHVQNMILHGVMYHGPGDITLKTIREYAQHKQNKTWRQATYPVRVEFNPNEKGEVKVYENKLPEAGDILVAESESIEMPMGADVPDGQEGAYYSAEDQDDDYGAAAADPVSVAVVPAVTPTTMKPEEVPIMQSTEFKLPAHIAAKQNAYATGAQAAIPAKKTFAEKTYTPNTHSAERMIAFMHEVYHRLSMHIFTVCGWTGTPVDGASDWHFSTPEQVVAKPVNISDIIHKYGMPDVIMEYNTHDDQGRKLYGPWAEKCQNGLIRGEIFRKSGLPGYTLWCNFNGACRARVLTPQNTAKDTITGAKARGGECLAYAIKQEAKDTDHDKWLGNFENGVWTPKKLS